MSMDNWMKDIESGMDTMKGTSVKLDNWRKTSIYTVPDHIRALDREGKLYRPVKVSLGPYYHNAPDLRPMEEHKTRSLRHFLMRSRKPLNSFVEALRNELDNLKGTYDQLDSNWQIADQSDDEFLKLMILDGCFILEVLNVYSKNVIYAPDDPTFGTHGSTVLPLIKRDMLLLGNQVPFGVIRILFQVAEGLQVGGATEIPEELSYPLLRFFSTSTSLLYLDWKAILKQPCLHLLDVYRKILLYDGFHKLYRERKISAESFAKADSVLFPSASKLYEAGIRFDRSSSTHLKDISFRGSTLIFPAIVIAEETISTLANLMAFERAHAGAGNEVTTFVYFLTCLIQNAEDVSLLKASGVIQNTLRNDQDVAKSLNLLSRDVLLGPNNMLNEVYQRVSRKLRSRVKKTLNEWWFDLLRTYFKTPWGALSVIAAIILLTLTMLQTVYTILGYTHPK